MDLNYRPLVTSIAKEIGIYGPDKPVQLKTGTDQVIQALIQHAPRDFSVLSDSARAWYAAKGVATGAAPPPDTRPEHALPGAGDVAATAPQILQTPGQPWPAAPFPPAVERPLIPPGSMLAKLVDGQTFVAPHAVPARPSREEAQAGKWQNGVWVLDEKIAAAPLPAWSQSGSAVPTPGEPAVPPEDAAVARFSGYDLKGMNLVAVPCPGSIAYNNAVCLLCPEAEDCIEQALVGVVRYPLKYTAPPQENFTKAEVQQAAASTNPGPEASYEERAARANALPAEKKMAMAFGAADGHDADCPQGGPPREGEPCCAAEARRARYVGQVDTLAKAYAGPPAPLESIADDVPPGDTTPAPAKKARAKKAPAVVGPDVGDPITDVYMLTTGANPRAIARLLQGFRLAGRVHKQVQYWSQDVVGQLVVKLKISRCGTNKPAVAFVGYRTEPGTMGLLQEPGVDPVWDGAELNRLEILIKHHLGL